MKVQNIAEESKEDGDKAQKFIPEAQDEFLLSAKKYAWGLFLAHLSETYLNLPLYKQTSYPMWKKGWQKLSGEKIYKQNNESN